METAEEVIKRRAVYVRAADEVIERQQAAARGRQVLVTLGLSFMIADACLMWWGGDPISIETPRALRGATFIAGLGFAT